HDVRVREQRAVADAEGSARGTLRLRALPGHRVVLALRGDLDLHDRRAQLLEIGPREERRGEEEEGEEGLGHRPSSVREGYTCRMRTVLRARDPAEAYRARDLLRENGM